MRLVSLHDLYVRELRDLYDVEQRLLESLPDMADAAHSPDLEGAFEAHLAETRAQVVRLEQIFADLGEEPKRLKCKGILGIIEESEETMDEDATPQVCDAALIASAQRIEHYEISGYGTARTYARQLGFAEQAELLQATLNEEIETDKKLTVLAEAHVNEDARTAG